MCKAKIIFVPLVVLILGMWGLSRCQPQPKTEVGTYALGDKEKEAVIINSNTGEVTVVKKTDSGGNRLRPAELRGSLPEPEESNSVSIERTGGVREVRISVGPGGEVTVTKKDKGLCFDVGPIGGFSDKWRAGVDVQWLYWRYWGISSGITIDTSGNSPTLYLGVDYKLHWLFIRNTSAVLGYDTNRDVFAGLKLNF